MNQTVTRPQHQHPESASWHVHQRRTQRLLNEPARPIPPVEFAPISDEPIIPRD